MPTELEEIRQIAAENLVPYSKQQPSLFKRLQLEPVKDLKLLVRDYDPIKQNALIMLINLSGDGEVREYLAKDDVFIDTILARITNPKERFADEFCMLLANLTKSDALTRLFTLERARVPALGSGSGNGNGGGEGEGDGSTNAMDQLMDVFVRGPEFNTYQAKSSSATYDHLAYVFADLAKHDAGAAYFAGPARAYDGVVPLAKLLPFTAVAGAEEGMAGAGAGTGTGSEGSPSFSSPSSSPSLTRRLGVASALKNVSFAVPRHGALLAAELELLRHVLVPLASGADAYADDEQDAMLDDLQLLDAGVRREPDARVLRAHLDTLLLLATTAPGRRALRDAGAYYVVRECHKAVEDDGVQEGCDRLVQVLQRGEPGEDEVEGEGEGKAGGKVLGEIQDDSDDDKIVDIV